MSYTDSGIAAPAAPTAPPPAMHPMDPRRGANLSPRFAAVLVWLLQLPPMTTPAIVGISVCGQLVLAATDRDPFHDTPIGDLQDLERNLREWAEACGADNPTVDSLLARLRRVRS